MKDADVMGCDLKANRIAGLREDSEAQQN